MKTANKKQINKSSTIDQVPTTTINKVPTITIDKVPTIILDETPRPVKKQPAYPAPRWTTFLAREEWEEVERHYAAQAHEDLVDQRIRDARRAGRIIIQDQFDFPRSSPSQPPRSKFMERLWEKAKAVAGKVKEASGKAKDNAGRVMRARV